MFLNRPHVYKEVVEQCVKASQAIEREDTAGKTTKEEICHLKKNRK